MPNDNPNSQKLNGTVRALVAVMGTLCALFLGLVTYSIQHATRADEKIEARAHAHAQRVETRCNEQVISSRSAIEKRLDDMKASQSEMRSEIRDQLKEIKEMIRRRDKVYKSTP